MIAQYEAPLGWSRVKTLSLEFERNKVKDDVVALFSIAPQRLRAGTTTNWPKPRECRGQSLQPDAPSCGRR